MPNVAILVGNTDYEYLHDIPCCYDDVHAMKELLVATKKFGDIKIIENAQGDDLKSAIRKLVGTYPSVGEFFLYYTGHGYYKKDEFYFCTQNFDRRRPNETGLSNSELHTLLRQANAELVVKVIDACNSGTSLIKGEIEVHAYDKSGFKNLIQISSCLESQNSLTGDPLSFFTEKFRNSTLRKKEGPIYYMDIINSLKDEFLQNDYQTPYFVSQVTGREKFVEDARSLDGVRNNIAQQSEVRMQVENGNSEGDAVAVSLVSILEKAEAMMVSKEKISSFVDGLFDSLSEKISKLNVDEYFDVQVDEHADYEERAMDEFMAKVLAREKRADEFVTAKISRKRKRSALFPYTSIGILGMFHNEREYEEVYDIWLNMRMDRAQLCVTLTPKFSNLRKIVLIVACAPSLERCYIFELVNKHCLSDIDEFQEEGSEIVRRWYKRGWGDDTGKVVDRIEDKVREVIHNHLEVTKDRLMK